MFTCENVALNLNRMFRVTKILLCQIQSARKILLSGNQPLGQKQRPIVSSLSADVIFFEVLVKCECHIEDGFKLERGDLRPQN